MADKTDTTPPEAHFKNAEEHNEDSFQLMWLNSIDESAEVISTLVMQISVIVVFVMSLITLNIGIAFWIGEYLETYYYGFFVVAAFYLVITTLLFLLRIYLLKTPIHKGIISRVFKQKQDEKRS